jgi:hypothetical protein
VKPARRIWVAVLLLGCLDEFPALPGDAGRPDGALVDAGDPDVLHTDATPLPDAGPPDAGPRDAGPRDAAPPDAAPLDASLPDATPDAAATPDTGGCGDERCNGLDDDCDGRLDEVLGAGEPCSAGLGQCFAAGVQACDLTLGVLACDAQPLESMDESCNDQDDDCDGATDEDFDLNLPCTVGVGLCAAPGLAACDDLGGVICLGQPGPAGMETCNGQDDDCDGLTDEGFGGVGTPCTVGQGACRREGRQICTPEGGLGCDIAPGPAADERCNGEDDDCDGRTDEDLGLDVACRVGVGLCEAPGRTVCGPQGDVVCGGLSGSPAPEVCDGRDQDCDGEIDNGFGLGEACFVGAGACVRVGTVTCQGCSAMPGPASPEACNDLDDDCDGRIDEGNACVATLVRGCRVWLGQADNDGVAPQPAPAWDGCPISDQDREGEVRCTSSGRDGYFYALPLTGDVDDNDVLSIALTCDDTPVLAWAQRSCSVFLAHADGGGAGAITPLDPATCASQIGSGSEPNPRCVHSGGDGLFHPMWLSGDVDENDVFGITFRCHDPARPERAAGLQDGLAVTLGWHFRAQGLAFECLAVNPPFMNDVPEWDGCPRDGVDASGTRRCATGTRAGAFRAFEIGDDHDVEECSALGIALRSR